MQKINELLEQIERLMADQQRMKAANKHYRKHKTMRGFTGVPDNSAEHWDSDVKLQENRVPYPPAVLASNSATIRRLKPKLQKLQDQQMDMEGERK